MIAIVLVEVPSPYLTSEEQSEPADPSKMPLNSSDLAAAPRAFAGIMTVATEVVAAVVVTAGVAELAMVSVFGPQERPPAPFVSKAVLLAPFDPGNR